MKKKISVSMDEELLSKIQSKLADGTFRNQSHLIELATRRLVEDGER